MAKLHHARQLNTYTNHARKDTSLAPVKNREEIMKLIIIGDSSVGKSNLTSRFVDNEFDEIHKTTIGVDFKVKRITVNGKKIKLQIWDTAGQERFKALTSSYYRGSHGVILVFDISCERTFTGLNVWLDDINKHTDVCDIPILLVGNKTDLKESRQVEYKRAKKDAEFNHMLYLETSAKSGYNVTQTFTKFATYIKALSDKADEHHKIMWDTYKKVGSEIDNLSQPRKSLIINSKNIIDEDTEDTDDKPIKCNCW